MNFYSISIFWKWKFFGSELGGVKLEEQQKWRTMEDTPACELCKSVVLINKCNYFNRWIRNWFHNTLTVSQETIILGGNWMIFVPKLEKDILIALSSKYCRREWNKSKMKFSRNCRRSIGEFKWPAE